MKTRSGRTLTRADLELLAAKAEAGFDLSRWSPKRGRPSLSASASGHSPRVGARIREDTYERFVERVHAEGKTPSQVVRSLVEKYVGQPRPKRNRPT